MQRIQQTLWLLWHSYGLFANLYGPIKILKALPCLNRVNLLFVFWTISNQVPGVIFESFTLYYWFAYICVSIDRANYTAIDFQFLKKKAHITRILPIFFQYARNIDSISFHSSWNQTFNDRHWTTRVFFFSYLVTFFSFFSDSGIYILIFKLE